MPNGKLLLRLGLDLTASVLLLVALAYYWLDNTAHELAGTGMFGLLIAHNVLNRRWYGGLRRPRDTRMSVDKVLVFCLLAAMAVLLVTSVMISQTVFAAIASPDAFTARRLHAFAAYWALVLVAVHLGIRWRVILGFLRRIPTAALRLAAAGIAGAGIYSSVEIGVGAKLLARVSLEGWDFSAATWGFFLHHLAIVGLYASLAHYAFGRRSQGRVRGETHGAPLGASVGGRSARPDLL